jgi:hypothetical protein
MMNLTGKVADEICKGMFDSDWGPGPISVRVLFKDRLLIQTILRIIIKEII